MKMLPLTGARSGERYLVNPYQIVSISSGCCVGDNGEQIRCNVVETTVENNVLYVQETFDQILKRL